MEQTGLTLKATRSNALATLVRLTGDFSLAEEAVQEASERAIINWPIKGIPENPVAWLVQTGRRYALDQFRHQSIVHRHQTEQSQPENNAANEDDYDNMHFSDDMLRLIFTCCHPALAREAQVALTLKTIVGLTIDEIARAFLVPTKTLEQRLTRTKRKIRDAAIAYEIPPQQELSQRLEPVMTVIYLIFNQSYTLATGKDLQDHQLSEAAIYLARMLNRLIRNHTEVQGLLALLLLQHARANARTNPEGFPIPLEQQDRLLWDKKLIAEGTVLVEICFRHSQPGPYALQAAIAAQHNRAQTPQETNWKEILNCYEQLEKDNPSPVITLNKAVAVARAYTPEEGLKLIDALESEKRLEEYHYFHSTKAALLEEMGKSLEAETAYSKAIKLCRNESELKYLQQKLASLIEASE